MNQKQRIVYYKIYTIITENGKKIIYSFVEYCERRGVVRTGHPS